MEWWFIGLFIWTTYLAIVRSKYSNERHQEVLEKIEDMRSDFKKQIKQIKKQMD